MRARGRGAIVWTVLALALGLSACASGGGGAFGDGRGHRWARVITFEELDALDAVDCYEAIQRLRPAWLRTRPRRGMPGIVLNGAPLRGDVDTLKGMLKSGVREIRFLSALDATTKFGRGYVNGAILVTSDVRQGWATP